MVWCVACLVSLTNRISYRAGYRADTRRAGVCGRTCIWQGSEIYKRRNMPNELLAGTAPRRSSGLIDPKLSFLSDHAVLAFREVLGETLKDAPMSPPHLALRVPNLFLHRGGCFVASERSNDVAQRICWPLRPACFPTLRDFSSTMLSPWSPSWSR